MIGQKRIGVVMPTYNEQRLIGKTIAGLPREVDRIIVVDDGSTDGTPEILKGVADSRLCVVTHERNKGLGQAIATGYKEILSDPTIDIGVVMASDNQMDPADLPAVVQPIVDRRALYVKGNRLFYPGVRQIMPGYRYVGNALLTLLTKFATGYFQLLDPQCGYTAIDRYALRLLDLDHPHKGYGYNANLLMQLNVYNVPVIDVPVRPVYGEAISKIKLWNYIPKVSWLLLRIFIKRILVKYIVRDFHPIGMMYLALALLLPIATYSGLVLAIARLSTLSSAFSLEALPSLMLFMMTSLSSINLFLFAIWMDIEYTRSRHHWEGLE